MGPDAAIADDKLFDKKLMHAIRKYDTAINGMIIYIYAGKTTALHALNISGEISPVSFNKRSSRATDSDDLYKVID